MDAIINGFAGLNLNDIGCVGREQEKRDILQAIRALPDGFNDNDLQRMNDITDDEIETFNADLIAIKHAISEFYIDSKGLYGSLNFGTNYASYTNIRQTVQQLNNNNNNDYARILSFILQPIDSLPEVAIIRQLDGVSKQARFSKICLNSAINLTLEKLSFIEGYWRKVQEQID